MRSVFEPLIKWSGSKRLQSYKILKYFPFSFKTYYEPFVGGGSMLYALNPDEGFWRHKAVCGDICEPLIDLWKLIQTHPLRLIESYTESWKRLQEEGQSVYYEIREQFNKNKNVEDFLFLSRTCVNGLIRFNSKGEFNSPIHHTRDGINPKTLRKILFRWHNRIKKVMFVCGDYRETIKKCSVEDLIYFDPPYLKTKAMYYGGIDFEEFKQCLEELNKRNVRYILSLDGTRGKSEFNHALPNILFKRHYFIGGGISTFPKVNEKKREKVYDSLYLNF